MTNINEADYATLSSAVSKIYNNDDLYEDIRYLQKADPAFRAMYKRCFSSIEECSDFIERHSTIWTEVRIDMNEDQKPLMVLVERSATDGDLLEYALEQIDSDLLECVNCDAIEEKGFETREMFVLVAYDEL